MTVITETDFFEYYTALLIEREIELERQAFSLNNYKLYVLGGVNMAFQSEMIITIARPARGRTIFPEIPEIKFGSARLIPNFVMKL